MRFGVPELPVLRLGATLAGLCLATAAGATCAPPASGPAVCLSGIATSPALKVAVIERPNRPGLDHVAEGGKIDGWAVTEIAPSYIVLTQDDRTVQLAVGGSTAEREMTAELPSPPHLPKPEPVQKWGHKDYRY